MKKITLLVFSLFIMSCASKKIAEPSAPRTQLFPAGVYEQKIQVLVPPSDKVKERKFGFNGVMEVRATHIKIVALSPLNTTLFTITETLPGGEVKTEIFNEKIKKHQQEVLKYYAKVKKIILQPAKGSENGLQVVSVDSNSMPTLIRDTAEQTDYVIKSYDKNKIPEEIEINQSQFLTKVKIKSYEI